MTVRRESFRIPEELLLPWPARETIDVEHAAEMMGCSGAVVRKLIEEGEIQAYKIREKGPSPWRIRYSSVVAHLEKIHKLNGLEKRF
jgi:excisionase family DNA binding protein